MHIVRTIVWVLLLIALTVFAAVNWDERATVQIWQNLVVETNIPAIVIISFLIGFVPMWLLHHTTKWQLKRRISSLEATARAAAHIPLATGSTAEPQPFPQPPLEPVTPAEHPAPLTARVDEYRPPNAT
jgi:uncharacterized integral membrane protein